MTISRALITVLLAWSIVPPVFGKDFTITLNAQNGTQFNTRGPQDDQFNPAIPLAQWGSTGYDAANFRNNSSKTIRGMKFISLYPEKYHFSPASGGNLFGQVVLNADRTEIIFRNITVPVAPKHWFWMSATRTADQPEGYDLFQALMFESNPSVPGGGTWETLTPQADQGDLLFKIAKVGNIEHENATIAITVTVINTGSHPFLFGQHNLTYQLTKGGKAFAIDLAHPGIADEQLLDSHQSSTRRIDLIAKGVSEGDYNLKVSAYGSQDERLVHLH
jgi:hypothetical protein